MPMVPFPSRPFLAPLHLLFPELLLGNVERKCSGFCLYPIFSISSLSWAPSRGAGLASNSLCLEGPGEVCYT